MPSGWPVDEFCARIASDPTERYAFHRRTKAKRLVASPIVFQLRGEHFCSVTITDFILSSDPPFGRLRRQVKDLVRDDDFQVFATVQ